MTESHKPSQNIRHLHRSPSASRPLVWAVGGGKGGIGKSFISSSLAICLARMGRSVTLVDLDLGGANIHTLLGLQVPDISISDYVTGRVPDLGKIAIDSKIPGLRVISGFNDAANIADLNREQKDRLINGLHFLPSTYVILDLGAGTSENTLDFFLSADQKIVAVTPEPTSIENAYRFLKATFYRALRETENEFGVHDLIEAAMDSRNAFGIRSPSDLIQKVRELHPEIGSQFAARIEQFHIQLLLNQVRTRDDINLGHSMKSVCRKYFGIDAQYLGYIEHDNAVWQALRKRRPVLVEAPHSSLVGQFMSVTKTLLNPHPLRAVV